MSRRIVCWLTDDPASVVEARLAVIEADVGALPVVAVVERGRMNMANLPACVEWLRIPVAIVSRCQAERYRLHGDVHVIGVPADEQDRHDAYIEANGGAAVLALLADRGMTRADCAAYTRRIGLNSSQWAMQ
ncbi:hypothetical protein POK33_38140 [Burkholderia cenocepacia]|uniref:hypothetical protein n=1 Tax=Burkholderia cenocepacia TaxID=95486 RepID=UPI0023B90CC5|nr:hypothetical protein [Burkholderia cenocepacia]MDF0506576.1 hypothetical protein [Burkholderia cenocepacia]